MGFHTVENVVVAVIQDTQEHWLEEEGILDFDQHPVEAPSG